MANVIINHAMSDEDRRRAVFAGDLVLQARDDTTAALAAHATTMIAEAFGELDPERAQFDLPVDDFVSRVGPLKSRFTNDQGTKELIRAVLDRYGCDLDRTFFDVPRLRVVPHGGYLSSGVSYAYKPHRDIWYASPPFQVNWWMPVFTVESTRAMSIFPSYFDQTVPNSSAAFDYGEWCRIGRQLAVSQVGEDTRTHPLPLAPVDTTHEIRFAGDTGDMLIFSASHLHATAPNDSGLTRFSIDFRTIALDDVEQGRAAPSVDCEARGTTMGDFIRASDFAAQLLAPASSMAASDE